MYREQSTPILYLDSESLRVWLQNKEVKLTRKAYQLLFFLVENSERYCSRTDILEAIWPNSVVTPELVKDYISTIRKALGDSVDSPRLIETKRHLGYRFVGTAVTVDTAGQPRNGTQKIAPLSSASDCYALIKKARQTMRTRDLASYHDSMFSLKTVQDTGLFQLEVSTTICRLHLMAHICDLGIDEVIHLDEALSHAALAYGLAPQSSDNIALFATSLAYNKEFKIARSFFERALEINSKDEPVLISYANYLCKVGQNEAAECVFSKLGPRQIGNHSSINWIRASNQFQLGNIKAAKELLEIHLKSFPRSTRPLHGYAAILATLGEREQCDELMENLLQKNSELSLESEYQYQRGYYRNDVEIQRWIDGAAKTGLR